MHQTSHNISMIIFLWCIPWCRDIASLTSLGSYNVCKVSLKRPIEGSLSVYRRQFPTHKPLYLLLNHTSRAIDVQNSSARSTLRNYIFNQRRRYYLRHRSLQSTEIVFAVYIRSLYQPLRV